MPIISNLQDFNMPQQSLNPNNQNQNQIQAQQVSNDRLMSSVIKGYSNTMSSAVNSVPNIMQEQRSNFITMFDILDRMEDKGMIKINPEVKATEEMSLKDFLIGTATIIGGIILFSLIV